MLLERLSQNESSFVLENDRLLIPDLIKHVQDYLVRMQLCDENARLRIGIALQESLLNAIYHGNLEVGSDLRQEDESLYHGLVEQRLHEAPYKDRRIFFSFKLTRSEAVRLGGPCELGGGTRSPAPPASVARDGRREERRYFFFAAFVAPPLLPRFSARSIFPSQVSAAARAFFLLP